MDCASWVIPFLMSPPIASSVLALQVGLLLQAQHLEQGPAQVGGTKKKAKMLQRMGFEGERTGWLNSGPY